MASRRRPSKRPDRWLRRAERLDGLRRLSDDESAECASLLPSAVRIVKRCFRPYPGLWEEAESVAGLAVVFAVATHNPARGVPLETFVSVKAWHGAYDAIRNRLELARRFEPRNDLDLTGDGSGDTAEEADARLDFEDITAGADDRTRRILLARLEGKRTKAIASDEGLSPTQIRRIMAAFRASLRNTRSRVAEDYGRNDAE